MFFFKFVVILVIFLLKLFFYNRKNNLINKFKLTSCTQKKLLSFSMMYTFQAISKIGSPFQKKI